MKLLIATVAALLATPLAAATAVYSAAPATGGNQSYGGTLGLNFDSSAALRIVSLGAFDSGRDGITTNINVAIFNRDTGSIVSPVVNFLGTANVAGTPYVSVAVTPFTLAAGHYQLGAWNYNGTDRNYNDGFSGVNPIGFNSLGGVLTALDATYSTGAGNLATIFDAGVTRYGAGTFSVADVPEPATWGLMVAGFGLVGVLRRRATVLA